VLARRGKCCGFSTHYFRQFLKPIEIVFRNAYIVYLLSKASMKALLLALCLGLAGIIGGQNVGIGTASPHASAVLDLSSPNKGVLIPRMTTATRVGIVSPAKGLLVYDSTVNNLVFHNGSAWTELVNTNNNFRM
jgi:hypothetical protein